MFVSVAWYIFHSKSLFLYCSALESSEHSKVLVTVDLDRRNVLDTFLKDTFINYNHIVICLKRYTALVLLSSVFSHEKTTGHESRSDVVRSLDRHNSQPPSGFRRKMLEYDGLAFFLEVYLKICLYPTYPNVWGLLPVST